MATTRRFHTTRWSLVLAAGQHDAPGSERALSSLCRIYWYPLYAFVRRQGQQPAAAQDLTQEFFARLLEKEYLQAADQQKGRFRTFLLTAFKRFLANERQRARAQKRGGGHRHLSLDFEDASLSGGATSAGPLRRGGGTRHRSPHRPVTPDDARRPRADRAAPANVP